MGLSTGDISYYRHNRSNVFVQSGVQFSIENTKFWSILANSGYFVANSRNF